MQIAIISYSIAAALFLVFALMLVTSWRGRLQGGFLVLAVVASLAWALAAVALARTESLLTISLYYVAELCRSLLWLAFLYRLYRPLREEGVRTRRWWLTTGVLAASGVLLAIQLLSSIGGGAYRPPFGVDLQLLGHLGIAVAGLTLIEQLFRYTRLDRMWEVKYLYFAVATLFGYDFFLYTDALLFKELDVTLWEARGFVNALAVPMLAVAATRNTSWSVRVFVSRKAVFHTSTIVAAGIYLLLMSAGGVYIRAYGGTWGEAAQVVFVAGAIFGLVVLLFSAQLRARLRVFLAKHFFSYRYDYRDEWLRLIQTLTDGTFGPGLRERSIRAMGDIVEATCGQLWMRDEGGGYAAVCAWKTGTPDAIEPETGPFVRFLQERDWVINLADYRRAPESHEGLELPAWLGSDPAAWLVVPLRHQSELIGFFVLGDARIERAINWEDRDLLRAAGQQAASYLALLDASDALNRANQFEAFNRLSAFVVHDLKNLVAQLELVVRNAKRHMHNPAFMEDAIMTVQNSVARMNRLLAELRKGRFEARNADLFDLFEVLPRVVAGFEGYAPAPTLLLSGSSAPVVADRDRMASVIGHLIRNAQEATPADGFVNLEARVEAGQAVVTIADNGSGMDESFIKERLFKPFETTKGNAGMGIGVYESREFLRSLGGTIEVSSRPEEGTIFTLRVPITDRGEDAVAPIEDREVCS